MKTRLASTAGGGLLLLAGGQACEAQAGSEYQGEPLVTVAGQVEAQQASPANIDVGVLWLLSDAQQECSGPQRTETGFATASDSDDGSCTSACGFPFDPAGPAAWESCERACGVDAHAGSYIEYDVCGSGGVGQTTPVFGNFPAEFSLDVLRPPPAEALMPSDTGERAALGYFVAVSQRADSLRLSPARGFPSWLLGGSETHVLMYAEDPIDEASTWGLYFRGAFAPGYHLLRVESGTRCEVPGVSAADDPTLLPAADTEPTVDPTTDAFGTPGNPGPPAAGQRAATSTEAPEVDPVPDFSGVADVCGNGVCEPGEDCSTCSDCMACAAGTTGVSSGITNRMGAYFCEATSGRVVAAAPGDEARVELLIAPPARIAWPDL